MFTGLIEEVGRIKSITPMGGGKRISVAANTIMDDLKIDDSVSINGACQTAVKVGKDYFEVEAVEETLRKSTLGTLKAGDRVNLERAAKLETRMGGHIVQGHVDCKGKVEKIIKEKTGIQLWIVFPEKYMRYIVPVGSICINGVSLTAARVEGNKFMSAIIPHTWKVTTLSELNSSSEVNLEFDIIGKYVEKMVDPHMQKDSGNPTKSSYLDKFIDQPEY
jgi:riboflavin synthase